MTIFTHGFRNPQICPYIRQSQRKMTPGKNVIVRLWEADLLSFRAIIERTVPVGKERVWCEPPGARNFPIFPGTSNYPSGNPGALMAR